MEAAIYRDMSLKPEALNLNPKRTKKNKPSITPKTQDRPCTLNRGYMVPNSGYLSPSRR